MDEIPFYFIYVIYSHVKRAKFSYLTWFISQYRASPQHCYLSTSLLFSSIFLTIPTPTTSLSWCHKQDSSSLYSFSTSHRTSYYRFTQPFLLTSFLYIWHLAKDGDQLNFPAFVSSAATSSTLGDYTKVVYSHPPTALQLIIKPNYTIHLTYIQLTDAMCLCKCILFIHRFIHFFCKRADQMEIINLKLNTKSDSLLFSVSINSLSHYLVHSPHLDSLFSSSCGMAVDWIKG